MQIFSTASTRLNTAQLIIVLDGEVCLSAPANSIDWHLGEFYFSGSQSYDLEKISEDAKYLILTTQLDLQEITGEVDELTLALMDEDFFHGQKSSDYKVASAHYLIQRILQSHDIPSDDENSMIDQILTFMQDHLDEKLSVDLISTEFELSKMQLIRLFTKEGKQPVMSELRSMRLEKAGQMLETSEVSIQQIAAATGFADSASFSHFFKKNTGKSPRQLRDEQKWLIWLSLLTKRFYLAYGGSPNGWELKGF